MVSKGAPFRWMSNRCPMYTFSKNPGMADKGFVCPRPENGREPGVRMTLKPGIFHNSDGCCVFGRNLPEWFWC